MTSGRSRPGAALQGPAVTGTGTWRAGRANLESLTDTRRAAIRGDVVLYSF